MSEGFEGVKNRVDNISTVKPILEALRTISLGSWQTALKRQRSMQTFSKNYDDILRIIGPKLKTEALTAPRKRRVDESAPLQPTIVLVVGSERGLCGSYNQMLMRALKKYREKEMAEERSVAVWVLGTRLYRLLRSAKIPVVWWQPLSSTALPEYSAVHKISAAWMRAYEQYRVDEVFIMAHHYRGPGRSIVRMERVLPFASFSDELEEDQEEEEQEIFPEPVIETDPVRIYFQVAKQMATMRMYEILLNAAAAEHSTRYQLMEEASQNAERMILEMTEILQMYRREAITREMQELAAGAGLLGN
ncbi:MAG TPA: hypothetical protein ENN32_02495 [Chloroflexi bacterium]|nr:hypothetical protein [Chloroflexota bacterium]